MKVKDANTLSQNHTGGGSGSRPPFWQDKKNLAIIGAGAAAILLIIGVAVALWPRDAQPSVSESSPIWSEPEDDKTYDAAEGLIDKDSFSGTVLPETPDAGRDYLDETLFLGDSNTYRYMMYADEDGSAFTSVDNTIGVVSMGVQAINNLKCMQFQGYKNPVTMPEAVKIMQPRRIIIGFGSNNLTANPKDFIESYQKGLKAIHDAYPYADLIVNAVPPLDKQREYTSLTMKQVDAFNKAIAEMCREEGYKFLDSSEALKDPVTGWAKKNYTLGDGVHLNKDGVNALFEYIRTHAYITEDKRPKPLKTIPKAKGVPPGLIEQDPIAVRGAKVPVNFVVDGEGTIEGKTSQMVKKSLSCSPVTAKPAEGWKFVGWSASIGQVGSSASLTYTVPADADANGVVITAHFEAAECEHEWEKIDYTEPTCTEDGVKYYRCKLCGAEKEKVWEALGHDYDENGVCKRCGAKDPNHQPEPEQHEHSWFEVARQEPGCETSGWVQYGCSCGETYTEELPATGHHFENGYCNRCGIPDPNCVPPASSSPAEEDAEMDDSVQMTE